MYMNTSNHKHKIVPSSISHETLGEPWNFSKTNSHQLKVGGGPMTPLIAIYKGHVQGQFIYIYVYIYIYISPFIYASARGPRKS